MNSQRRGSPRLLSTRGAALLGGRAELRDELDQEPNALGGPEVCVSEFHVGSSAWSRTLNLVGTTIKWNSKEFVDLFGQAIQEVRIIGCKSSLKRQGR